MEKVLEVIVDELKSIIKKDITRRMIEGVAFKAFEDWWDCQEKKTKVSYFHPLLSLKWLIKSCGEYMNFLCLCIIINIIIVLSIRY